MKVGENSTLAEILVSPGAEDILHKHGVPCMSCPLAAQEINSLTIGQVAKIYDLDGDKIVEDLNNNLNERK